MDRITYKGFYTISSYCKIDNVYHGRIENSDDLVTWECDAFYDVAASFHQAVDDYLETLEEIGR